jgi:hypothetical protein
MVKKDIVYIVVIAALIVAVVAVAFQDILITDSQQQALGKLKGIYGLITEADVDILSVEEESGLYKVIIRSNGAAGDMVEEVYITKDGSLLTDKIVITDDYTTTLTKQKAFIECLMDKKLLIFGQSNEPNSIQQLNILGTLSYKIFVDCVGANLEACQQLGIEQIPTIVYENNAYTGAKNIEWFEELTGCGY